MRMLIDLLSLLDAEYIAFTFSIALGFAVALFGFAAGMIYFFY